MTTSRWIRQLSALALAVALAASAVAAPEGSWSALGPEGAGVGVITVDPNDPSRIYAVADGPRPLYVSTDGGGTWGPTGFGLPEVGFRPLTVAPGDSDRIYALAGGEPFDLVYRSTDRGETFTLAGTASEPLGVRSLVADPLDPDTVYMMGQPAAFDAGYHGLLRSTDGGETWAGVGFVDRSVTSMVFDPGDGQRLFVTSDLDRAVHLTTDGGSTWEDVSTGQIPTTTNLPSVLAVTPTSPTTLLVGTQGLGSDVGIYRSTDDGDTWSAAAMPAPRNIVVRIVASDATNVYAIEPFASRLLRSTDGGASWEEASLAPPVERLALDIGATPTHVLAADLAEGVLRSADGGDSWETGSGFHSARVGSVAISPDDPLHLWAAVGSAVHASTDGGDTWSLAGTSPVGLWMSDLSPDPDAGTTLVAADRSVVRSSDGGATWTEVLPWSETGSTRHEIVARDPFDASHLLAVEKTSMGDAEAHASTDGGATWTPLAPLPTAPLDLAFDPTAAGRLFSVGGGDAYRSTDGGASWTTLSPQHLGSPLAFWTIMVDPRDGSVYGGTATDTYRSTDAGDTWAPTVPIGDRVSAWLADGTSLYAGTASSGVFATDDGGGTWTPLAGGQALPEVAVLVSAPGVLYAGTLGAGVVRLTADDILFADGFESGDATAWAAEL